jgi:hypothetical protein
MLSMLSTMQELYAKGIIAVLSLSKVHLTADEFSLPAHLLLQEPWASIMQAIYAKGIIVIRTAGNEGDPMAGQGLFYAGEAVGRRLWLSVTVCAVWCLHVICTAGNEGDPMAGQGLFYAGKHELMCLPGDPIVHHLCCDTWLWLDAQQLAWSRHRTEVVTHQSSLPDVHKVNSAV